MKPLVIVEVEDGMVSETTCYGGAEVIVLDWDNLSVGDGDPQAEIDGILASGLSAEEMQPYLDRLRVFRDMEDEDDYLDEDDDEDDDLDALGDPIDYE